MSSSHCLLCGALLLPGKSCQDLYNELAFYTLSHPDKEHFIHQHLVDAYASQHITANTKPIGFAAPLMGLYLFSEKNYTGKEVQEAHVQIGNKMKEWPKLSIPSEKALITVRDVLKEKTGEDRDEMIKKWVRAAWDIWKAEHARIREITDRQLAELKAA